MPGSSAQGLAHLPVDKFPTDRLPVAVWEDLPIFELASTAQGSSASAAGLSHLPVDLFPVDHFPEAAVQYVPFADLFDF